MFTPFDAPSADQLWLQIAEAFREGKGTSQHGRGGVTNEILHASLCIHNPRERWIASRSPALNPAFALAEVVWILLGRNDSKFLNYFNRRLPEYAGTGPTYHGAYGHRLIHQWKIDQLHQAYQALKSKPTSRQVVLQIWDPRSDFPEDGGLPRAPDIPCNICALMKVQGNRLEWTQIMRSNDVFRGLPFNIIQFTTLHEIIAGWLGLELGHYHHVSDSLHVYHDSLNDVLSSQRIEIPPNTDRLSASYDETMRAARSLGALVDLAICEENSAGSLANQFECLELPEAWKNVGSILLFEACRKRGNRELAKATMSNCTNPTYRLLVERWVERCR